MYIYRLTNELAGRGHLVDVIHDADSFLLLSSDEPKGDYPHHPNVRIHTLKSKAGFLSPLLTQQTGRPFFKQRTIRRLIDENQYDVIHYHNMSLIGIGAVQYGNGVKLYTTHEHWLVCPMHVLWKYNREVCTSESCISCQIRGKRPPQWWRYSRLFERMLPHVDAFISPSRFTLQQHLNRGLKIPIRHIPYFLPEHPEEESKGTTSANITDRPYFLFVGRLEKIKGLQNLIPVFQKRPEFELKIAGEGTYEEVLKRLAGKAPNIQFLGKLSQEELKGLYRNTTAVIVPSVCYEVFGMIIIESFARKTPVIANNLGALPEVIEDSAGGMIYNNEEQLVECMKRLLSDREYRTELGEKGYRAYMKYWNEESHVRQYFDLIQEIEKKKQATAVGEDT